MRHFANISLALYFAHYKQWPLFKLGFPIELTTAVAVATDWNPLSSLATLFHCQLIRIAVLTTTTAAEFKCIPPDGYEAKKNALVSDRTGPYLVGTYFN